MNTCQAGTISIDFAAACASGSPAHNNFGYGGPNSGVEGIRYEGVGQVNGVRLDLVARATSSYLAGNNNNNGCNGLFGQINVWANNQVDLEFSFEDPAGARVTLPSFWFSFFDLDHERNGNRVEQLVLSGYSSYSLTSPTDVAVSLPNPTMPYSRIFSSTVEGGGNDNPDDPLDLNDEQRRRSVIFFFEHRLLHGAVQGRGALKELGPQLPLCEQVERRRLVPAGAAHPLRHHRRPRLRPCPRLLRPRPHPPPPDVTYHQIAASCAVGIRIRSAGQPSLCALGLEGGVETSSYNTRLEFTTDATLPPHGGTFSAL